MFGTKSRAECAGSNRQQIPTILSLLLLLLLHARARGNEEGGGDKAQGYQQLEALAWRRGARFPKVEVRTDAETGERGLFVKTGQVIEVGEPILVVPGTFALLSEAVLQPFRRSGAAVPPGIAALTAHERLMLRLLEECITPRSAWGAYLRALPPLGDLAASLPYLWPDTLLRALNGAA